jgi:hypothetical protein
MQLFGDLERFAATVFYPLRFVLAAIAIAGVVVLVVVAVRRGWLAAARRHPGRAGILTAVALVVLAPAAWYLGSPLLIRTELIEPPPAALIASPDPITPEPSATPGRTPVASASAIASTPVPSAPSSPPPSPTPAATPIVRSGAFSGADDFHFGRGRATLTEAADGALTLRFDDFSVRNGPDLYVYLSPDPAGYADGVIELGRLRATDGSFNTPIPPGTDATGARSVVIWCREFAVLFAVASLDG